MNTITANISEEVPRNYTRNHTRIRDVSTPLELAVFLEEMASDPDWDISEYCRARAKAESRHLRMAPPASQRFGVTARGPAGELMFTDQALCDLAAEVENYLDYCATRRREADLLHVDPSQVKLSRSEWENVRIRELIHEKEEREASVSSFLSWPSQSAPGVFRVM